MGKKVKILPGCIGCGLCEALAPQIFKVNNVSRVQQEADFGRYEDEIEEAVRSCPISVIIYKEEVE